jgi:hypothetical protein
VPVSCHAMVSARVTADLDTMTILHTDTLRTHPKNVPLVFIAVTCAIHSTFTIVFFFLKVKQPQWIAALLGACHTSSSCGSLINGGRPCAPGSISALQPQTRCGLP